MEDVNLGKVKAFSPIVIEKTNTDTEYVLTITNENGSFDTPNLRGADGTELPLATNKIAGKVIVGETMVSSNGILNLAPEIIIPGFTILNTDWILDEEKYYYIKEITGVSELETYRPIVFYDEATTLRADFRDYISTTETGIRIAINQTPGFDMVVDSISLRRVI